MMKIDIDQFFVQADKSENMAPLNFWISKKEEYLSPSETVSQMMNNCLTSVQKDTFIDLLFTTVGGTISNRSNLLK